MAGLIGAGASGEEIGMVAQPFGRGNPLLARISAGMPVVDATGAPVGTARRVYLGGEDLAGALVPADSPLADVPAALFDHLAKSGFVEIATGPAAADLYAAGEQIAALEDGGVRLSVGQGTLARK
ncbi:MAG TPA: hypothetical protein VM899_14045 [Rubellimicrobium sp.]|nr:hypothetical protein [Rubellimicrobium sp.]